MQPFHAFRRLLFVFFIVLGGSLFHPGGAYAVDGDGSSSQSSDLSIQAGGLSQTGSDGTLTQTGDVSQTSSGGTLTQTGSVYGQSCVSDGECPSSMVCSNGYCSDPCVVGPTCPPGQVTDCRGGCKPGEGGNVPEMSIYVAGVLLLAGAGFILYRRRQLKIS